MSMTRQNVVDLPAEAERRRRGLFAVTGRHRRTPETWARMEEELAAARATEAQMRRERDDARSKVDKLERMVNTMHHDMSELRSEVRQMRALMGPDSDNPANQETFTIVPPVPEDPSEVITQSISQAELFKDDPMAPLRPVIRVHDFVPPKQASSDAVTQLLDRINPDDEKVKHIDVTQPIPLWDSPMSQSWRVERHTA